MTEKDRIKLVYRVLPDGRERLENFYFNDKGVNIPSKNNKADEEILKELPISKLDRLVLEKRPLTAILSIGHFKLTEDIVENKDDIDCGHYIYYKKI